MELVGSNLVQTLLDHLKVLWHYSLSKTVGKVSPILVKLTSRSDSDFESSNVSLKENKPDGVNRTLTISTTTFEIMEEKFSGFRQTD